MTKHEKARGEGVGLLVLALAALLLGGKRSAGGGSGGGGTDLGGSGALADLTAQPSPTSPGPYTWMGGSTAPSSTPSTDPAPQDPQTPAARASIFNGSPSVSTASVFAPISSGGAPAGPLLRSQGSSPLLTLMDQVGSRPPGGGATRETVTRGTFQTTPETGTPPRVLAFATPLPWTAAATPPLVTSSPSDGLSGPSVANTNASFNPNFSTIIAKPAAPAPAPAEWHAPLVVPPAAGPAPGPSYGNGIVGPAFQATTAPTPSFLNAAHAPASSAHAAALAPIPMLIPTPFAPAQTGQQRKATKRLEAS